MERSVHRARRLALAAPLAIWIVVAVWSIPLLHAARVRFARTPLPELAVLAFVVVLRKPEPLAPEYDRYTIGIGGLPFNRGGRPAPPARESGAGEG